MDCGLGGLQLTFGRTFLPRGTSAALEQVSPIWKARNSTHLIRHSHGSLKLVLPTVS